MKEGQSTFRERVLTAGIVAYVAYVAMFAGAHLALAVAFGLEGCERQGREDARGMAERTAEEIRWDVLREIDGQMERGGATTGRFGNGVAVSGAAGPQAGAAQAGAQAGGTPTPPSGAAQTGAQAGGTPTLPSGAAQH